MRRIGNILIILMLAVMVGACSVRTADDGATSASDGDSVGIENPFIGGGEEDDDDIIISEGGSSGGSGSPSPAPAAPQYEPLEIVTTKFVDCYQNLPFYKKLEGHGGSEHYEWTVTGLPDGISGGKYISGTTKASPGNYTVTVTLKDTETEESISKHFSLKVIKFIKEDIEIRVSQFVDGKWNVLKKEDENFIPLAAFDAKTRRLKLEVTGEGNYFKIIGDNSDPSYKMPQASRFHWKAISNDYRLSVFVPPAKKGEAIKKGQTAYLMPWGEKNDLEFKAMGIVASKNNLENTEITVRDDFGNTASVTFGEIDIEETTFIKCSINHEPPRIEIPARTDFSTNILKDPNKDKSTTTDVRAYDGVAPYTWVIGSWEDETQIQYPYMVPGHARAWTEIGCDPDTSPFCSHATISWLDIQLSNDAYPAWEIFGELPIKLTDACGETVESTAKLRIYFPDDDLNTLQTYAKIGDACNTDANSEYIHKLSIGGQHVATAVWELDPVPCDGDDFEDAIKDAVHNKYPATPTIVSGMEKKNVKDIDYFGLIVTESADEDPVYVYAYRTYFYTETWRASHKDFWFIMEPDEKTQHGTWDDPIVETPYFTDWEPCYETIPEEHRFGGVDEDDDPLVRYCIPPFP